MGRRARHRGASSLGISVAALLCAAALSGCFAAPPQIVSLDPARGSSGVPADQPIKVHFDRGVIPSSVASRFHITPALPGCDVRAAFAAAPGAVCAVTWDSNDEVMTFSHSGALFAPAAHYVITLDAGFSDSAGAANALDHRWDLYTQAQPRVVSITPSSATVAVSTDAVISVTFDRPMDASAAAAISLTPAPAGAHVVRDDANPARFTVMPGRLLGSNTAYSVNVDISARDQHGLTLGKPFSFSFTTGTLVAGTRLAVAARNAGRTSVWLINAASHGVAFDIADFDAATAVDQIALGPDGTRLALVTHAPTVASRLVVVDTTSGATLYRRDGGSWPSWSRRGALAFGLGQTAQIWEPDGTVATLALPGTLTAAPAWSADANGVFFAIRTASGATAMDFAVPRLHTVYPVITAVAAVTDPVASSDGQSVVVRSANAASPATWVVNPGTGTSSLLARDSTPVGFLDPATVLVVHSTPSTTTLAGVAINSGELHTLVTLNADIGPQEADVSSDGRQLAYIQPGAGGGGATAYLANGDGSGATALSSLIAGTPLAVSFSP